MTDFTTTRVLFLCKGCGTTYLATQERREGAGRFDCSSCRQPVHAWSGAYDYPLWKIVKSSKELDGRRND